MLGLLWIMVVIMTEIKVRKSQIVGLYISSIVAPGAGKDIKGHMMDTFLLLHITVGASLIKELQRVLM